MGVHENITDTKYPKQGDRLGRIVVVCFHYDTSKTVTGKIVRDDCEPPYETIMLLEDGRYVLSRECQWRTLAEKDYAESRRQK